MSDEAPVEEREAPEEEETAEPEPENKQVVDQVMAERKEKKKTKRKVVKSNEGLNNFLSTKKIKTSGKKKAGKSSAPAMTSQNVLIGSLIAAGLIGGMAYAGTARKKVTPNNAPAPSPPSQNASPPARASTTEDSLQGPNWMGDGGL